jgi:hypothetical protein
MKFTKNDPKQLRRRTHGEKLAPLRVTPVLVHRTIPWDNSFVRPYSSRLLVRTPDGFSTHRPFFRHRKFHLHSHHAAPILPSTCYPTFVRVSRIGFIPQKFWSKLGFNQCPEEHVRKSHYVEQNYHFKSETPEVLVFNLGLNAPAYQYTPYR